MQISYNNPAILYKMAGLMQLIRNFMIIFALRKQVEQIFINDMEPKLNLDRFIIAQDWKRGN